MQGHGQVFGAIGVGRAMAETGMTVPLEMAIAFGIGEKTRVSTGLSSWG